MPVETVTSANVKQAVPFFAVSNMESSLRFYVDGLGFKMKRWWIPDQSDGQDHYKADGKIRWCWLELGEAAIMLQEFLPERQPKETLGVTGHEVFRGFSHENCGYFLAFVPVLPSCFPHVLLLLRWD